MEMDGHQEEERWRCKKKMKKRKNSIALRRSCLPLLLLFIISFTNHNSLYIVINATNLTAKRTPQFIISQGHIAFEDGWHQT